MIDMDDVENKLAAYADGELDEAGAREVEAYIAANPAAQETVSIHRETASLLRAAFSESLFASPEVTLPPPQHRRFRFPSQSWAVAASILLGVLGYGAGAHWPNLLISDRDRMLTEIAEYHAVYSRETVHLVEVPAAQADHLKMWLGKRVNRNLVIPDFRSAGLTFAGGRMVVLDGAPVAELMYTREKGLPIAFCVLYRERKPAAMTVGNRGAINLAAWDDGSHSYFVVGEAEQAVIRDLATLAQRQI